MLKSLFYCDGDCFSSFKRGGYWPVLDQSLKTLLTKSEQGSDKENIYLGEDSKFLLLFIWYFSQSKVNQNRKK